ncbi:Hypothetical protein RMP42_05814 (plasmid) [Roseomonas mucosa]|nr:Hypothetical protein RMP42_05814 [Roseomonas mucosa]
MSLLRYWQVEDGRRDGPASANWRNDARACHLARLPLSGADRPFPPPREAPSTPYASRAIRHGRVRPHAGRTASSEHIAERNVPRQQRNRNPHAFDYFP